jgi:YfiH family protein
VPSPTLELVERDGIAFWTDPRLADTAGVIVGFSARSGGVSQPPYSSLNLAHHVGDDPVCVDENRERFMTALGTGPMRDRLVTAEQVHGSCAAVVDHESAGAGAFAHGEEKGPLRETDALVTSVVALPLMILFADCLPLALVSHAPRAVAVVHAGWRGAAAGVHVTALETLCGHAGTDPSEVDVYIGPHIGPCHYQVGPEVLSQFVHTSVTISAASGPLDLEAVVSEDLERTGVRKERIAAIPDSCTAEHPDRFYSYRAEGATGRLGALVMLAEGGR